MAISGSWKGQTRNSVPYAGPQRWGTGVNRVHGIRANEGRNIAPGVATDVIEPELVSEAETYGYADEDSPDVVFGYGTDTGMADRPGLGELNDRPATADKFPAWGNKRGGIPGGARIRAEDHGADAGLMTRIPQREAAPDFIGKTESEELESEVSDVDQVYRQTSMQQLHRVRSGSQRGSGSASEYSAPVPTRVPGMRVRPDTGGYRHDEMRPKAQRAIIRAFRRRTAGTGRVEDMRANEFYRSEPMQRTQPNDPNVGPTAGNLAVGNEYGFVDEDMTW